MIPNKIYQKQPPSFFKNLKLIVMKRIVTITAAILIIIALHAQNYSYQVANSQQVRKDMWPIASDNNGNVIMTGYFANSITFGAYTLTHTDGSDQVFIAKKLPDGSFAWAKKFIPLSITNGTSYMHIYGVCTDAAGNVYLTGYFVGKFSFNVPNVSLTSIKNGTTYTTDICTIKMSPDGTVIWAKSAGTANDGCNAGEYGRSVTVDNGGNVYVTGSMVTKVFKNTTICNDIPGGPSCTNATTKSITSPYIVKYNSSGLKVWEKTYVNNGALVSTSCWYNNPAGRDIRTDGTNLYVTGRFYGTVNFGVGSLSTGSESVSNVFLLKLAANGSTVWSRSVSGAANTNYNVGDGLFVNGNDIYISGLQYGTVSFGTCSLMSGSSPTFLAKYSSSGSCQWAVIPEGTCYGVVNHPNGNIASLVRRGASSPMRYDIKVFSPLDGSVVESTVFPDADTATGSITGYPSLAQTPDGFVFSHMVTGTYHFGNLTITASVPKGGGWADMMLIKYSASAPPIARQGNNIAKEASNSNLILYPNPASNQLTIQNSNNKILGAISIYDISGKMIYKKIAGSSQATIDVKSFPAGVYYLRSDQLQTAIKFVKQ
jgi:hypothetical protein